MELFFEPELSRNAVKRLMDELRLRLPAGAAGRAETSLRSYEVDFRSLLPKKVESRSTEGARNVDGIEVVRSSLCNFLLLV